MDFVPRDGKSDLARSDVDALLFLGHEHARAGRHTDARDCYAQAMQHGHHDAQAALGVSLVAHDPKSPQDGIRMIIEASNNGGAEAARQLAFMAAAGAGVPQDWHAAVNLLRRAAELGSPAARTELALLADETIPSSPPPTIWHELQDRIDLAAHLRTPEPQKAFQVPRIFTIGEFISPRICDWLIECARPKIQPAKIFDSATGQRGTDRGRSNSAAEFTFADPGMILAILRARIAQATGLAIQGLEHTQVLHYAPGEEFAAHFDFLNPAVPSYAQEIAVRGQRLATFLIYLNDDFDGAETAFLDLDWKFKGSKGDAVFFWNVDTAGQPDRRTRHAGLPPRTGEKWLLSQWIRGRA